MNPDHDPAIAEGNDRAAEHDAAAEQPGTELEARRELLPAEIVAAPNRAGAMVAEFVGSIVEEAQARALDMIRAAAEGDDAGQREALESADRLRARVDVMAEELETAVGQLRQESERLAGLRQQTTAAALTGGPAQADTAERDALAQVRAGLEAGPQVETEPPQAEEHDEGPHDVEIVHGHEEDEPEAEDETVHEAAVEGEAEEELDEPAAEATTVVGEPAEAEAEPAEEAVEAEEPAADEPAAEAGEPAAETEAAKPSPEAERLSEEEELARDQERFALMSDPELAQAYSRALDDMDLQPAESEKGARLLRYAGSALGEALTRPTFADIGQGAPVLEDVPRVGRRRRKRAEAINTLRRACAQAIEEMSADEAVSSR